MCLVTAIHRLSMQTHNPVCMVVRLQVFPMSVSQPLNLSTSCSTWKGRTASTDKKITSCSDQQCMGITKNLDLFPLMFSLSHLGERPALWCQLKQTYVARTKPGKYLFNSETNSHKTFCGGRFYELKSWGKTGAAPRIISKANTAEQQRKRHLENNSVLTFNKSCSKTRNDIDTLKGNSCKKTRNKAHNDFFILCH